MKRLYLLRHAKSSWKEPGIEDLERPLSGRGRRAANAIARYLRDNGIDPELVLCSPARRARETLEGIEPALGVRSVRVEPGLYGADASTLLAHLQGVPDSIGSVMLIGHHPGLQQLTLDLVGTEDEVRGLQEKYPTGALATLVIPGTSWGALNSGTAELVGFVRPRDLEA